MPDVRLIDANALDERIEELKYNQPSFAAAILLDALMTHVDAMPTIDAVPVVRGRWQRCVVDRRHRIEADKCSVCGFKYDGLGIEFFRYCPNCGAKMDVKEE